MRPIKKLDSYILSKFLPVFLGAFFICLFVFMMQFTWRYVDELIGKGLSLEILGRFFWYMGITLVPQALPLGILLASLITFGNMGENLELLAMKAAGVPLVRIMRPIFFVVLLLTGTAFYFQNSTAPEAQVNMRQLLFSMKQSSPAVEIPEGVFYSGVPNVNIFVQKKNAETGKLYQLIIYKTDQGFDRAQIVLADSGRMEMTADKLHLRLDLWSGEQFENLQSQGMLSGKAMRSQPYDRETFAYKQFVIDFDSNFNMLDKELLAGMPSAKNMRKIEHDVDSVEHKLDSVARVNYGAARITYYRYPKLSKTDSTTLYRQLKAHPMPFDSIVANLSPERRQAAEQMAKSNVAMAKADLEWKAMATEEDDKYVRRHWVEWHQKITLSLACIMFFFVGAPLGAIIRKGGLGMPTVISVAIFIFYYIINTSGMKMARDGSWNMLWGMWVSTIVLTPFGVFLTYKSNRDSVVFNIDLYTAVLRRLLGLRTKRHITRKEVIIDEPRYDELPAEIAALRADCRAYNERVKLIKAPSYLTIFFRYRPDHDVESIAARVETLVEELSNSRRREELQAVNALPMLYAEAHTTPLRSRRLNIAAGLFFPLGILLWFRIWRFRLRLLRDMKQVVNVCNRLEFLLTKDEERAAEDAEQARPTAELVAATPERAEAGDESLTAADEAARRDKRRRFRIFRRCLFVVILLVALAMVAVNVVRNAKHKRSMPDDLPVTERPEGVKAGGRPSK